jgi:hypothetical protein
MAGNLGTVMDVLAWIWWLVSSFVGFTLALIWFLLGGWVVTLVQIGVVALLVMGWRYGWQRAPQELAMRVAWAGRWAWAMIRRRPRPARQPEETRLRRRRALARRRAPGDINLSTLLNLALLLGLWLLAQLGPR